MIELRKLHKEAIPAAIEKVERYRLLNEPDNAESICRDVLDVDPDNQFAVVQFILCLTDRFSEGLSERFHAAWEAASHLTDEYEREYYRGIVCERRAKAHFKRGTPAAGHLAYEWLQKAMEYYDRAEKIRPEGNDASILRWNTCARMIMKHPEIQLLEEADSESSVQLE